MMLDQPDAPEPEIEITPSMVEAGYDALFD